MKNPVLDIIAAKAAKPIEHRNDTSTSRLQIWVISILCLVIPLPFFSSIQSGYDIPKVTLLVIAVLALIVLWVRKALYCGSAEIPRPVITVLVVLVALTLFISTLTSINPVRSLIGDLSRVEGMVTWIAYLLLFLFTSAISFSDREVKQVLLASLIGASLVSIFGIAQFFGFGSIAASMGASRAPFEVYRPYSTFGNPDTFAEYLALVFPIAFVFPLVSNGKKRFIYIIPLVLISLALIATLTRGAWIAALIAVTAIVFMYRPKIKTSQGKAIIATIIILAIAASIVFGITLSKDPSAVERFSIKSMTSGSAAMRLAAYSIASKALAQRPAFGYGLENFRTAFIKNRDDHFVAMARYREISDRAHNLILDLAVGGGVIFLNLLAALILVVMAKSTKLARGSLITIGLITAVLAYLVSLMFGFSTPGATVTFFVFLGILSNQAIGALKIPITVGLGRRRFLIGVTVTFSAALVILSMLPITSIYYYVQGENFRRAEALETALSCYERSRSIFPWYSKYHLAIGQTSSLLYLEQNYRDEAILKAKEAYDEALKLDPYGRDAVFHNALFYFAFKDLDANSVDRATSLLEKQLELDPYAIRARLVLADIYEQTGRLKNAKVLREQAIRLSIRFRWVSNPALQNNLKNAAMQLQAADARNPIVAEYLKSTSNQGSK